MALENKKSLLQPSSTQAQQFRLQFTNLQPTSLTAQQPSPVANARPAVSAFANTPAPVSLQAPATIPPALPSNPPIVYSDTAFYFDGSSLFSSSLELIDTPINLTGSFGVMMAIKPTVWVTGSTQTILHMYSGSFASQSFNISLVNGDIQVTYRNNGQTVTYSRNVTNEATLGNGYTLVTFDYYGNSEYDPLTNPYYGFPYLYPNNVTTNAVPAQITQTSIESLSASFTDIDHLYIGGTKFESGKNFVGSIGFIALSSDFPFTTTYSNIQFNQKYSNGKPARPKDLITAGVYKTRVYTFGEPNGNAYAIETTGSAATKSVPLVLSGSVYTAQNYSYFTV